MLKHKGNLAESAVIYELSKLNLPVFKELGDSSSVDLITIVNGKTITIQVKYCEIDNGSVGLYLKKSGPGGYKRQYLKEDFDLFALYIKDIQTTIWINSEEALSATKSLISFRVDKSKKDKRIRNYIDYLDFYKAINKGG